MENLLKHIEDLRERVINVWNLLEIDRQEAELRDLKFNMAQPDFWNDRARAIAVGKKAEELEKEVEEWKAISKEARELEELVALGNVEGDESFSDDAAQTYEKLKARFLQSEFLVLFSGQYDKNDVVLSIHAGVGGVDAQDWAQILERMYLRFCEKKNWQAEILDRTVGNEAGIKNVTIKISGRWAYGYLKNENGVHRLVRISPFDAEGMRHTSFALVEIIPDLPEARDFEIHENDLRIDVFRSSGAGGQSVNTTDSAVRIVHKPTGLTVTCQNERSQHQNKERAMQILKTKLYQLELGKKEQEEARLKGGVQRAEWGKQIRSYVLQPYQMVKDHRTGFETSNIDFVLDGNLDGIIESELRMNVNK